MEQRVRSLNKLFWIGITVTTILSCRRNREEAPAFFFNAKQHAFHQQEGKMYMEGKLFSGYMYALFENKDTALLAPFIDGLEQGTEKSWYENGSRKEIRLYQKGKKTGEHLGWWPDGKKKFIYHYRDDKYEGEVTEWYESGQLFKTFHYQNGQEQGLQTQYFSTGDLQCNYEARNGRHYGLTGVKNCVNVKEKNSDLK